MKNAKKFMASAAAAVMLAVSTTAISASAATYYPEARCRLLGDVNQNGVIDSNDYNALYKYFLGDNVIGVDWDSADVDENGVVNSRDLTYMRKILIINLRNADDYNSEYRFTYNGEVFKATYADGSWKIENSYKIRNKADRLLICQLLKDRHPILGKNGKRPYRTAEDMEYEWVVHNAAYKYMIFTGATADNPIVISTKDVDLDPKDQGKTFAEFYKEKKGEELKYNIDPYSIDAML